MNSLLTYLFLILSFSLLLTIHSCGEPEEEQEQQLVGISDDFNIVGRWNFQTVSGDGVIFGVPQSSTDENPMGYVEFFEDGTGYSDFEVLLLNQPFELQDTVVWSRRAIDTLVVQAVTEGKVDVWHIIGANATDVNAEWPIDIAGNTATLNAQFTKE